MLTKLTCRFMLTNKVAVFQVKSNSANERDVLKNVGVFYDLLADAVDQINSVYSKQVRFFRGI